MSVIDEPAHVAVGLQLLEMSSITTPNQTISNVCTRYIFQRTLFLGKILAILPIWDNEKKLNTVIACKRNRFDFWNSCKRLQNFVNVEALVLTQL